MWLARVPAAAWEGNRFTLKSADATLYSHYD